MIQRLLPMSLFLLAVQARAATVTVADVSAEYSDEVQLEATVEHEGQPMGGQQLSFSVNRTDSEGVDRVVVNGGVGVTDSNGRAAVSIRLINGRTGSGTVHELKPDRSEDEIWRSFMAGEYVVKAQRMAGDLESGVGTLTIRREQAALTLHPVQTIAGQTTSVVISLADDGDNSTDWDWSDGEAVESSKSGVQGRKLTVWMDRNGDDQFYNCTAGGSCVGGRCVQCQSDDDCPGSVCDQGLCVAEAGLNTCSVDDDCAPFFGVQGLHCLNGTCVAEACDYMGETTTDVLGRARFDFDTAPNEFGHPSVGEHELMLRAEFAGDDYYAGVASRGDLFITPGELDLSQVPITLTIGGETVTEVGKTDTIAVEMRAYLSDVYGNLFGYNDQPYIILPGDCASCEDTYCQELSQPICMKRLTVDDVTFNASSGIFVSPMTRNPDDGAFMRPWRPIETPDDTVTFTVQLGDMESPAASLRLFDTGGCGCTGGSPASLLWLLVVPALRRRRRP